MSRKLLTLCLAQDGGRILLAMKKKGFGANRWNGMGGKVEAGETIEQAAIRECKEEAGIDVAALKRAGILEFEFKKKPGEILQVHLFRITKFHGEPLETDEMRPQWFNLSDIPYDAMWPDDRHWLPLFLAQKKFKGYFLFGDNDAILKKEIEEWRNFDNYKEVPVVNSVVVYKGKMLLVKRASGMEYHPGKWNGISGFFEEPSVKDQITKEVNEELGLGAEHILSIKEGELFSIKDTVVGRVWRVHPVLVELDTDHIELDWEADDFRWIDPLEATSFNLVPGFEKVMAALEKLV